MALIIRNTNVYFLAWDGALSLYTKEMVVLDKGGWHFPSGILFSPETKSVCKKIDSHFPKLCDIYAPSFINS